MQEVRIGKGMCRITIRSKEKLKQLSKIPEVKVEGSRVVFPEWMRDNIKCILNPKAKPKGRKTAQSDLFDNDVRQ